MSAFMKLRSNASSFDELVVGRAETVLVAVSVEPA
jgi:hypothetical protein